MSDTKLKVPVHRTVTLLKDKLTAQNTDIWNENGTPDYASGNYCELINGESLTSKKTFESGVLTFYAYAADWTDVKMGFMLADDVDEVIYENDDFVSEANNLTPVVSNAVLADATAYFFKIIWCSQFVSIDIWTLAGVSIVSKMHRNPTNRAMPLFFTTSTADALQIANLSLQEADDAEFFQEVETGVELSDDDPIKGNRTAYEGIGEEASRDDHIHPDLSRDPDYDSGWFGLAQNANVTKTHNIGTSKCLVELHGRTGVGNIHKFYGGWTVGGIGAWWENLLANTIRVHRGIADTLFVNLRVFVWGLI